MAGTWDDQRRSEGGAWPFGRRAQDQVTLTKRQAAVLELVARGYQNRQIAASLGISEQGAKQDVSAVLTRFDLPNRAALARAAITMKLLGTSGARDIPVEYLFDRAPLLIAMTSGPEHVFTVVNRTYVSCFGHRPYVGRPFRKVFADVDGSALAERLDAAFRGGQAVRIVEQHLSWRTAAGVQRETYLTLLIEVTRNTTGAVDGLVLFGSNATTRVEARRGIEAARQMPSSVPEAHPALAPQAPLGGARWARSGLLMEHTDSPAVRALAGRPSETDVLLGQEDGRDIRVHVSARPVRHAGQVRGAVLVLTKVAPPPPPRERRHPAVSVIASATGCGLVVSSPVARLHTKPLSHTNANWPVT